MNIKKINLILVLLMSIAFLSATVSRAEGNKKDGGKNLRKTSQVSFTYLDVNNISTYFYNNGDSDLGPNSNSGFVYPKGSGKTAVFEAGFIWGAKIDTAASQDPYVGGSTYGSGLQPGAVDLKTGKADDPNADAASIFRAVAPGTDLGPIASNENISESALKAQLDADAANWPAAKGAPYDDVNNNGSYDPGTDIPGVPGADMTLWFVANDLNNTLILQFYGAPTLGVEMQATIWAYNKAGALGNMYFRKYKIINVTGRGGDTPAATTFYDMYVSMWADVDLGNAGDDFVGVDTVLSLQYCYNANAVDATYSPLPPPAVGFDFFQGPLLDGVAGQDRNKNGIDDALDYGIFNGKKVGPGKINLPMTAAYYFANGDANIGDPPLNNGPGAEGIEGSRQFYNFMQGKFGLSGQTFTDLSTGQPTTYALNGDPQKGTGWLDGDQLPAGDRRQGSASGPFTMAPGDTQEVVVAEIVGGAITGSDRLSAIGILKFYDQQAQLAYDNFFDLPSAPPAPVVTAIPLDQKITLDWSKDKAAVMATESNNAKGFSFQGYNVYQLPSASSTISEAKRLATYDIVDGVGKIEDQFFDSNTGVVAVGVRQFGNDTGIKRYISITKDVINGGTPIVNGLKYYFAVTSYNYNPTQNVVPNNIENPINIITVVPQTPDPGTRLGATSGDTLKVTHATGASDAKISPEVVDPTALTGHSYTVKFTAGGTDTNKTAVADAWTLYDNTSSSVVYSSDNLSGTESGAITDTANYYPVVDGFHINVFSPPAGFASLTFPTGTRWVGGVNWGGRYFGGSMDVGENFFGTDVLPTDYFPVELKWTDNPVMSEANGWAQGAAMLQSAGYAVQGKGWMPFQTFDISDTANPRQVNVSFRINNATPTKLVWDMGWDGTAFASLGARNYTFIQKTSYNPDMYLAGTGTDPSVNDVLYAWWPDKRSDAHPYLEDKFTMVIVPNYPALVQDTYTFTGTAPTTSSALAKQDVNKINVFPNPYYGVNSQELNKYNRFVTFNHLPANATIRIFNLAGVMVRTIVHSGGDQYQRWDLANENGLPVASGLYIAYIDMPDLGTTKILKFAIIQEQQILDRF